LMAPRPARSARPARPANRQLALSTVALLAVPTLIILASRPGAAVTALLLAPLALTAVVVLAVVGTARGTGVLVDVGVADGTVVVRPRGINQWWSLRRCISAPAASVVDIGVARAADLPAGVRSPGTSVRGYRAGTYGVGAERSFWLRRKAEHVLVIELVDRPLRRLVLEVPDPEATAKELRIALRR
ncbi:MAG: hypothetical protein ABIW46_00135, partial [Acidimicrobiales bacterium]